MLVFMLDHGRRWANSEPTLGEHLVFVGSNQAQQSARPIKELLSLSRDGISQSQPVIQL